MDFTFREFIVAVLGSAGLIGGLVSAAAFISSRIDARRKRQADELAKHALQTVESKRLDLDANTLGRAYLTGILEERKQEVEKLKLEIEECEKQEVLQKKVIVEMYKHIRQGLEELGHLNVMYFDQEQTIVLNNRLEATRKHFEEMRNLLP